MSKFTNILAALLLMVAISCNGNVAENINGTSKSKPSTEKILEEIRQCSDLVTTELIVRKVLIYDSSKSEHFTWTDLKTWKVGDRKCIIPIEVHIKYGYDLNEIAIDDVRVTDDSTAVEITLPEPKIIDAGYNTYIDDNSVVNIATGMRDKIGHELKEEIRRKGYESIMKEDMSQYINTDIENNTRTLFESIIKDLGFERGIIIAGKHNNQTNKLQR